MNSKNIFNENHVKKLANILNDSNLTEIEYENNGIRIRLYKSSRPNLTQDDHRENVAPIRTEKNVIDSSSVIKSPMVGVAYLSADPDSPAYVKVGQHVKAGDTLLLIEAMKTFNEIKAPKSGVIKKIVALNSQPVEFGDHLIIFE